MPGKSALKKLRGRVLVWRQSLSPHPPHGPRPPPPRQSTKRGAGKSRAAPWPGHSGAHACISKSGSAVPGAFLCLTYFQKNNICFGGTQHRDIIYPFKNSKTLTNPQRMFPPQLSWSLGIQASGSKNLLSATPSPGRCPELESLGETPNPSPAVGRGPHKVRSPAPLGERSAG